MCVLNPITDQPLHTKEAKKEEREGEGRNEK